MYGDSIKSKYLSDWLIKLSLTSSRRYVAMMNVTPHAPRPSVDCLANYCGQFMYMRKANIRDHSNLS